jgi:LAO/AO transport system kinase
VGTEPQASAYAKGVLSGDRAMLARAITLIESRNLGHQKLAQDMLATLLPRSGKSLRIGISGLPGAGKSTFIDTFGTMLTGQGHKVAVLAVDPSSSRTGGSILADKTRMPRLAQDASAFIRPSPTGGALGGVAHATREAILVCEAAGFDIILVETVGVGQNEIAVADMVDVFLVLMIAGGGDELQGIKKGVLEIADIVAITKADGDNLARAAKTAADYQHALRITTPAGARWTPPVLSVSALENKGIDAVWAQIQQHRRTMLDTNTFETKRRAQDIGWMWSIIDDRLMTRLKADPRITRLAEDLERAVSDGTMTPGMAADRLLDSFLSSRGENQ